MHEFDELEEATCYTCVQWQEMIENVNRKLAQLGKPIGMCAIHDPVSFADADSLKNPEVYEQKVALEEELQAEVKTLTLVLLSHQRSEHSSVVAS